MLTAMALAPSARAAELPLQALLDRYAAEPSNALLCEQIGVEYARLNDFSKAAEFFQKAVTLNPNRLPARKNLATVLWFASRKDESATLFAALAKSIPNDPVPQLYLGLHAYDNQEMEAAAVHFEHAGELASNNPDTLPAVVQAYISTGRAALACQLLERQIAAGRADSQTYRWLGEAYDKEMKPDKAFDAYSQAIKEQPKADDNYLALAAFSMEHANLPFAREVLQRGLQQSPGSAKLMLETGLAWGIQGDFEKARESFAAASAADPSWSLPLLALGVTDLQTGAAERAAESFRRAKQIAPDDYRCYYLHATAQIRSPGTDAAKRAAEISELQRAIQLQPRYAPSRVALAEVELAGGDTAGAESELREAIRIDPTDGAALYKLALICRRNGKKDEAARLIARFQQLKNKAHSEENQFVLILKTVN